jgi:hypothetical protein
MEEFIYFKFRAINKYLIDSLVKGTLYFSLPAHLNDPFDCQIDIKKAAKHAISKLSGMKCDILKKISGPEGYFDEIQTRMKKVGICSFSLKLEDPLLWSHYADEHRGLCLTYQFPEDFLMDTSNRIVGVSQLEYDENPLTNWFIENAPEKYGTNFEDHFTTELLKKVLIIKGKGWSYEDEARIIREKEGNFPIPKKFLKQVCFGLNTSEHYISLIRQIIENSGYSVNYCQILRKEDDFGIKAVEI